MKRLLPLLTAAILFSIPQVKADEVYGIDRFAQSKIGTSRHDANGNVIGGSPAGCPRTRFCGCALALKVFGKHNRSLWPARAWFKFPRTTARQGAVAVTRRHVFYLMSHVEGTRWLAYDPNSGGHKTRIHERDIRGTTIVDPHASQVAMGTILSAVTTGDPRTSGVER